MAEGGRDRHRLARIHRVRTLQLGLARADEAVAEQRVASEAALSQRIAELAAAVAPAPETRGAAAFHAAAHYRERLHHSAAAAAGRVAAAEQAHARATEDARTAKRDQSAVEKLLDRARQDLVRRDLRALEDAPAAPKRHDPC